jgi:hypothetical protein
VIDELAHTNAPGSRHTKRWEEDVEQVLDAGISVLATLNVQHLESLNDVVEQIIGVPQRETAPDAVVRRGDQIGLPRRCAAGWPTATSTRPRRSTRRRGIASGSATSPRCANSPCCGWPIRSTGVCGGTGPST